MKLTVEQRTQLFTRLVEAMAREGVLVQAVAALPADLREAFYQAAPAPSAEEARAAIAAMTSGQRERAMHCKLAEMALKPSREADLKDRLDEDGAREYYQLMLRKGRGPVQDKDWLRRRAEASLLTPKQVAANRRRRLEGAARDYNEHLNALIELGPLDGTDMEPVTTGDAGSHGDGHEQECTRGRT